MIRCEVVDDSGAPLDGVAVSDGEAVVRTDARGVAEVPGAGPFVWVSRPDGLDTDRWFARTGDPAGGTDRPVRFELHRATQTLPVTFTHITDLHVSALPEPASMPQEDSLVGRDEDGNLALKPLTTAEDLVRVLDELAGTEGVDGPPRFFVATGDLTDHGTHDDYRLLAEALSASPLPVLTLPGNHDHHGLEERPRPDATASVDRGITADTLGRYEAHVGPRWWSLTHAGLRLVAIDWFSHLLGIDDDVQERWLAADLATAPEGTPVLLLAHDQMPSAFHERMAAAAPHVRLLGSLSGHWHTSRVVRHDGQVHANTGNATFGSFDWTPAQGRHVSWDGDRLALRTVAVGGGDRLAGATFRARRGPTEPLPSSRWTAGLPGAAHLARPLGLDGCVVVAWSDDDAGAGGVSCHDATTGEERWRADLDAPVRAGVTMVPDAEALVAVSIAGEVVGLDPASGEERWRHQVGDPLRAWVMSSPVAVDGAAAVGNVTEMVLLDGRTGSVVWHRDDLDGSMPMATPLRGVVQDGVLVVGFSFNDLHTVGMDPADGSVLWTGDGMRFNAPLSDIVADPDGRDVVVTRLAGRVERLAAATGERRWQVGVGAAFAPGRPLIVGDGLVVTNALGWVHRLDRSDGSRVWRTRLPGGDLLPMGPYRRDGLAVPAGPVATGDGTIVQTAGDGGVHRLDPTDGAVLASVDLAVPITVPAVPFDDGGWVATADGPLARLAL